MKFQSHKEYEKRKPYWEDCYNLIVEGDTHTIKSLGVKYLPMLESHIREGASQGKADYEVFKSDAVWYDIPRGSMDDILGLMFEKPSQYALPTQLQPYKEKIMVSGEGLDSLEFKVQIGQLSYGRCGIIASPITDITSKALPVISYYDPQCIVNWHIKDIGGKDKYDYVLIKLNTQEFNYKKMAYEDQVYYIVHAVNEKGRYFKVKLKQSELPSFNFDWERHPSYIEPEYKGKFLDFVPFVALNVTNIDGETEVPPLYEIAMQSLQAYKSSGLVQRKNRQQTWSLLTLCGFDFENEINKAQKSDGYIKAKNPNAKGAYISPDSTNLSEMRQILERHIYEAETRGVYVSQKNTAEASRALEIRVGNQSNAYRTMAYFRNKAIEKLLRYICEWAGIVVPEENPLIVPYLDFKMVVNTVDDALKASSLVDNGKLPEDDYYRFLKKSGLTNYETYDDFRANLKNSIFED